MELSPASEEDGFRLLALWRVPHKTGGGWKSQNRKNVYLSPYVEEPLNSKVIKSFVTELRSRKCFLCFEIPMFYVYIYEHYMSISGIRIWQWYTKGINPKARLEFELAFYNVAVQHLSHYATWVPPLPLSYFYNSKDEQNWWQLDGWLVGFLGYQSSLNRARYTLGLAWHIIYCFTPCVIWKPLKWTNNVV